MVRNTVFKLELYTLIKAKIQLVDKLRSIFARSIDRFFQQKVFRLKLNPAKVPQYISARVLFQRSYTEYCGQSRKRSV